jgi:CheY-like chemotaxis protein
MDLPRHTEAPSGKQSQTAVRHAPEFLPAGEGLPIRVLILEDDPETAETLSLILSLDEGFVVEIVHDVATCLERLQADITLTDLSDRGHVHTFDVLLLDMLLRAGHVGTEVLAATADAPYLELPPVVICTALPPSYLAAHEPTLRLAANNIRVLLKPFDIDTLMTELRVAASAGRRNQVRDLMTSPE